MKFEANKKYRIIRKYFTLDGNAGPYGGCDVDVGDIFTCCHVSASGNAYANDVTYQGWAERNSGWKIAEQHHLDNGFVVPVVEESNSVTSKLTNEEFDKLIKILIDSPEPVGRFVDAIKSVKTSLVEEQ